ncbi:hypothetical protein LJR034_005736 [Caballeronia sp. LjRoot34]|uniref:hypothetical protein n=1 Tax=Caballeronia sp. LjRoot34 TaxID=3342325 RepID=UPI003ECCD7BF
MTGLSTRTSTACTQFAVRGVDPRQLQQNAGYGDPGIEGVHGPNWNADLRRGMTSDRRRANISRPHRVPQPG